MQLKEHWRGIAINMLILIGLTFFGGAVVGAFVGIRSPQGALTLAVVNLLMMVLGFFIAGMRTKTDYWQQLWCVAILGWLFGLINLFFGLNFFQWAASAFAVSISMGIGGGLAKLVRPKTQAPGIEAHFD